MKKTRFIYTLASISLLATTLLSRGDSRPSEQPATAEPEITRNAGMTEKPTDWQARAAASLAKGQQWLISRQSEDGSWSEAHYPALTALALQALADSKAEAAEASARKAVQFILRHQQPDGGFYVDLPERKGGGLSTYNTAICMTALQKTGLPEVREPLLKARAFLIAAQYRGEESVHVGGFGYDAQRNRSYTDLNNTHYALEAMSLTREMADAHPQAGSRHDIDWKAALDYVASLQVQPQDGPLYAGGFIYNPIDPKAGTVTLENGRVVIKPYGSASYVGMVALLAAGTKPDNPRMQALLQYCISNWSLTENPAMGQQGLFFYYVTLAKGLNMAGSQAFTGKTGSPLKNWQRELALKLVSLQRSDGSWINENGRFAESDPVLATAYSAIALQLTLGD